MVTVSPGEQPLGVEVPQEVAKIVHKAATDHKPPMGDSMVVMPKHYSRFEIEPVRFCAENGLTFLVSNTVKYVVRAPYKHATPVQDMTKAIRCIIMETKRLLGDPDWWKPYKSPDLERLITEELTYAPSQA